MWQVLEKQLVDELTQVASVERRNAYVVRASEREHQDLLNVFHFRCTLPGSIASSQAVPRPLGRVVLSTSPNRFFLPRVSAFFSQMETEVKCTSRFPNRLLLCQPCVCPRWDQSERQLQGPLCDSHSSVSTSPGVALAFA